MRHTMKHCTGNDLDMHISDIISDNVYVYGHTSDIDEFDILYGLYYCNRYWLTTMWWRMQLINFILLK